MYVDLPEEGGSGGAGVSSLNSLTGALTLVGGTGITITPSGSSITITNSAANDPILNPSASLQVVEDFCIGDYQSGSGEVMSENAWKTIQSGGPSFTCSGTFTPSTNAHPGVLQIEVSAAGTDVGSISTGYFNASTNEFMLVGNGQWQLDIVFNMPVLSNGTNNSELMFGWLDSPPGSASANAIYMQYEIELGTLNWVCGTISSSVSTSVTSSVPVTAGWHHATIIVDATGSNVYYYMDTVLIATITTNIPTAGMPPLIGYRKTLGAAAMYLGIDYINIQKIFTTPR